MAIYDVNWKSYAMYTVCTVESGADYGAIERYAMAGIGIAQWTYGRSWQLLNMMATDYPETESMFPILWNSIKPGTSSWGQKTFTQSEANEISTALVTDQGVATQDKLWNQDCDQTYIPLLRDKCSLTDPKGAIFGLSIHHQSPQAFYQVYSAVGNQSTQAWYNGAINNGIVGKYKGRQDTVKRLLDEWDGESGKEGFGTRDPSISEGGNSDPNNGNPDDTWANTIAEVHFNAVELLKDDIILHIEYNNKPRKLLFYKASNTLWYPKFKQADIEGETEDTPIPNPPDTGGTPEDLVWIVDKIKSLESTLKYSQAQDKRTNIPGGYCDCSGLVWWLYNERGVKLGTWTGTQKENGRLIEEGGGGNYPDESKMQLGDLCLFDWGDTGYTSSGHIELYIGDGQIMGHGGRPPVGPVKKVITSYFQAARHWMVRRVIEE